MRLKRFLPFGPFAPDAPDRDTPVLDEAKNVLPVFGSYRPVPKSEVAVQETSAGSAINGAIAHLVTEGAAKLHARPNATDSAGDWIGVDEEGVESTTDLHSPIDESIADDKDYDTWRTDDNGNATVEVNLNDVEDPASATDHLLHYRFRFVRAPNDYELQVRLLQYGSPLSTAVTKTYNQASYSTGVWYQAQEALSAAQANAIANDGTNYDDLSLEFKGTLSAIAGGPDKQFGDPGDDDSNLDNWKESDGDTASDIYTAIDDSDPIADGDSDWIYTPDLLENEVATYVCDLGAMEDPRIDSGHVVRYRYAVATAFPMDLDVYLVEEVDGIDTVRASNSHASVVATSATTGTITLSSAEADSITDYTKLKLKFVYENVSSAGGDRTSSPNADVSLGNWTDKAGGTTNIYQSVDEGVADDTDYIKIVSGGLERYRCTIAGISEPSDHSETKIAIRPWYPGGPGGKLKVRIAYNSGSNWFEWDWGFISWITPTTKTWKLTEAQSQALDWGDDFTVEIERYGTTTETTTYNSWIQLQIPSGTNTGRIYNAFLETPEAYGVDVSYAEFEVPDTTSYTHPDNVVVYAGNTNSIYKVAATGFTDMSVTSDASYAGSNEDPMSWSWCSWGDDVICTNFVDPVQLYDTSGAGARFEDLITEPSSNIPKARFVGVVGEHLVLANITNRTGYGEYSVWWSAINDPQKFYEPDYTTQSDFQHLRQTPGSITGFVGGEYGTIFKPNSIYRMSYVGPPLVFSFHVLSLNQGTVYPRSIVSVDGDVYFLGNSGFYVLRGGLQLEPIGDGVITKMFLDSRNEDNALFEDAAESLVTREGNVIGGYNPYLQLIFWFYRDSAADPLENSMGLVYNPKEGRWSRLADMTDDSATGTATTVSALIPIPNVITAASGLLKTLGVFRYDSANDIADYAKLTSYHTYPLEVKTKILSSAHITGSENMRGRDLFIRGVRPIFRTDPDATLRPPVEIEVKASDDLLMLSANTNTETVDTNSRNRDGWYLLSDRLEGEYFTFKLSLDEWRCPFVLDEALEEITGIEIDAETAGEI
jgi:hypothetical protein